jgi:hypothetical protein
MFKAHQGKVGEEERPHSGDCEHGELLEGDGTQDGEKALLRNIGNVIAQGVTFQQMVNFKVIKYVELRGTW